MCEDNAVNALMRFNFAGMANEVEDALAFKARNADPLIQPSYSRIIYTWFIRRGDYRQGRYFFSLQVLAAQLSIAALVMYQRARKLQHLINDPTSFSSLAEAQLEAYTVAINALSLVDEKNAWLVLPVPPEHVHEVRNFETNKKSGEL